MAQPWAPDAAPARHDAGTVTLVEGSTFCLSAGDGDIVAGRPHGLFVRDTRVISRWELAIDGAMPEPLTVHTDEPFAGAFLGHVIGPDGPATSNLLVVRRRYIGDGMREDITLRNVTAQETTCVLTLTIDADFADLFEVKEERVSPPEGVVRTASDSALRITRRRRHHRLGMTIRADADPEITDGILRWESRLPAHAEWTASVEAVPSVDDIAISLRHPRGRPVEHAIPARKSFASGGGRARRSAPVTEPLPRSSSAVSRTSAHSGSSTPNTPNDRSSQPEPPGSWPCSAGTLC